MILILLVGTPFVCETMELYLSRNSSDLLDLPCKEIRTYLVAYGVIKHYEKEKLDDRYCDEKQKLMTRMFGTLDQEQRQMARVLETIRRSLQHKHTKPFKRFLELMEHSSDQRLQEAAKKLG